MVQRLKPQTTTGGNELVSVIVPVFNVRPYLTEAMDSVIHQSYSNLEIIIIDDGSTDGSGELCDRYAEIDERIIVIHQNNNGLSVARNIGLDIMNGDVVAFLDSDDAYHPDFILTMLEAMNRENADLVICQYTTYRTDGRMNPSHNKKTVPRISQGTYDCCSALRALADGKLDSFVWNKLYRSELWKDVRYPAGHVYEDIDTICRIIELCTTVYILDTSLYMYRKRSGSISEIWSRDNLQDWLLSYIHFGSFIRENIPDLFTDEQLMRWQQRMLSILFYRYGSISLKKAGGSEIGIEELRRMVLREGDKIGIESCGFVIQISYNLIRYCPGLYKVAFFGFYLIWQIIKKI